MSTERRCWIVSTRSKPPLRVYADSLDLHASTGALIFRGLDPLPEGDPTGDHLDAVLGDPFEEKPGPVVLYSIAAGEWRNVEAIDPETGEPIAVLEDERDNRTERERERQANSPAGLVDLEAASRGRFA